MSTFKSCIVFIAVIIYVPVLRAQDTGPIKLPKEAFQAWEKQTRLMSSSNIACEVRETTVNSAETREMEFLIKKQGEFISLASKNEKGDEGAFVAGPKHNFAIRRESGSDPWLVSEVAPTGEEKGMQVAVFTELASKLLTVPHAFNSLGFDVIFQSKAMRIDNWKETEIDGVRWLVWNSVGWTLMQNRFTGGSPTNTSFREHSSLRVSVSSCRCVDWR